MTSKAIVEKCQAEQIPNMNNHMSSVSAGLEATIVEWFSEPSEGGTAVESTAHVDLEKVRAKPKKRAKAKAKAKPAEVAADDGGDVAVAVADAPAVAPPPVETVETTVEAPVEKAEPAQPATAAAASAPDEPSGDAPDTTAPPEEPSTAAPIMNVPERPKVVAPAGPRLEDHMQKPAKLSGPKVVRVEAPENISTPRRGGGGGGMAGGGQRGGRGAGVGGPGVVPGPAEDPGRSSRRNKRRTGAPGEGQSNRRGGRGADRGGGGAGAGSWRQQDLIEREARLNRAGGFLRQRRREIKRKQQMGSTERAATPATTGGAVKIAAPFTIKDLSSATGVRASEIIKKLFLQGVMATVNSGIETEQAQEIMIDYNIELEVEEARTAEEVVTDQFADRETVDARRRSPVVTILGHVDHGKTSLLDKIRKSDVAAGEAGGITQATSAFRVPVYTGDKEHKVVFIDTPGHEAFTQMRARGAQMTDMVVLVVAADDGVMPQTAESISHAKAAGVPLVVAMNKIDKPEVNDAQIQKIYGQLAEHELNPVEWGGDTEVIKTSAETGEGIEDLLETLDYQAELLELTGDFGGPARGVVIESKPVEGRGSVANLLVQDGELKVGQFIVAGRAFGRVRDITDDRGKRIEIATPAMPVQISGLDMLPDAGDRFYIVDSLKKAQEAAEQRRDRERERELAQPKVTLESMFSQMEAGKVAELVVVIKADVQGSVDVLKKAAEDITTEDVRVKVLHAAVGGVTDSDVLLADASSAVIIGFNVIASASARQLAEQKNIEVRNYQVIYDIVDDLKKAAAGLLEPEIRQEVIGHAEVRAVFKISKVGAVAGCYVTDGTIERNAFIRVTRDDIVIENDRVLEQLKRFKDDAKEVRSGQECGMKIVGYDDIKEGDVLECYRKVEVARTL